MKKRGRYFSPAQAHIVLIMLEHPDALIYSSGSDHYQHLRNDKHFGEEGLISEYFRRSTLNVLLELKCLIEVKKNGKWPVYRLVNSVETKGQALPPA